MRYPILDFDTPVNNPSKMSKNLSQNHHKIKQFNSVIWASYFILKLQSHTDFSRYRAKLSKTTSLIAK